MFRNHLALLLSVFLFISFAQYAVAQTQLDEFQNDDISILFLYSNYQNEMSPDVIKIDMLLRHFTRHVRVVSAQNAESRDFGLATHVFYYGEHKQEINEFILQELDTFTGPVVVIGENGEQIPSFHHFKQLGEINVNGISQAGDEHDMTSLPSMTLIKQIKENDKQDILLYGHRGQVTYPLLAQEGHRYYFAVTAIDSIIQSYFAEILHDILPNDHPHEHLAYLRLEDIHPLTDPDKLLEVGEYLNDRNIPYILVVIPVYITPGTGERVYFSDSPTLVKVLQHLQNNSGTVIAHGYTHQYRDSETGEGFEFWDVENNQFIISNDPRASIEKIKSQDSFANEQDYMTYLKSLKEKERDYIEQRLRQSIHELVSYSLYPLSFEAPHYTMSQQGYSIVANYFSNLLGEIQLSDEEWTVMDSPPYVTTGQNLNGMTLYPETIGYVDPSLPNPFQETEKRVDQVSIVRDSVIGGFYHPYLGIEYLPEFLAKYEKISNVTWLDLKKTKQWVLTEDVHIQSDGTGEIFVEDTLSSLSGVINKQDSASLLEKILWGVTIIVSLFVLLFFLFSIYLRTRVRKRLFRERKSVG